MATVSKGKEIQVTMKDSLGAGANIFHALKDAQINVVASSGFQHGDEVHLSIVPEDIEKAQRVLRKQNIEFTTKDVLLVAMPNKAGAFATLLQSIAELGVNIKSAYATTTVKKSALAVLITDNDKKVLKELNK